MSIQNDSTASGAGMIIWDCHGGQSQQFQPIALSDGTYQLKSVLSQKCLDLVGNKIANGIQANLWDCNSLIATQHWKLVFDPINTQGWQIKSGVNNSYCLDLKDQSANAGALIHLWSCYTMTSQSWQVANTSSAFATADGAGSLQTWWHSDYEWNSSTPVADNKVRRSGFYSVRISDPQSPLLKYDDFTYMSIPRGGRQKWGYSGQDGAENASSNRMTMSWSSFLYRSGTWVDVQFFNQKVSTVDDIIIQPSALGLKKVKIDDHTISIYVPYRSQGYRFSVEHRNEMITVSAGQQLPRNAMLIFAEPFPTNGDGVVPTANQEDIYYPPPGRLTGLENITKKVIYFRPGVYFMDWNYAAILRPNVQQIYLAPGAYVKGAFEMVPFGGRFSVTGQGVLSGEKYVYMADTKAPLPFSHGTDTAHCWQYCLKLLQFDLNADSQLQITGVTLADPPYYSYVNWGTKKFPMTVDRYKQVGAWYWQTNGIQLTSNSTMNSSFIHSNDDTINVYGDNLSYKDTVVWKGENGPVIQFGWRAQNVSNVLIDGVELIHNQMSWNTADNMCVINSAGGNEFGGSLLDADDPNPTSSKTIQNVTFQNIHVNGKVPCAIRIYALSNLNNILIKNLLIDQWTDTPFMNIFSAVKDKYGAPVSTGGQLSGLKILNYRVGDQFISKWDGSWRADRLGHLNFDANLLSTWNCWVDQSQL